MITYERAKRCVTHYYGCDCREYRLECAEAEVERLRDGIRALAVKFDRSADKHREEGFNGQAGLWEMAADKTRALLREDGQ